jgi:ribulose-5-phosphate 4-epimerase/fuculose-1-phosphate aldolase
MAFLTLTIQSEAEALPRVLSEKHFLRKHGAQAYYGQKNG